jgi:thioredoxin reductase (NADPH)
MAAVDFLARAHDLHPAAKRVLLVERGDWSARHPAVSAMTLGKIDYHLWAEPRYPELLLYPAVSDFLAQREKSREPSFAAVRVVGTPNSASVHQLREAMSRGGVPYWFLDADSDEGRSLLRDVGAEGAPLPIAAYFDGTCFPSRRHRISWPRWVSSGKCR